jgi:hypothetical protein
MSNIHVTSTERRKDGTLVFRCNKCGYRARYDKSLKVERRGASDTKHLNSYADDNYKGEDLSWVTPEIESNIDYALRNL